MKRPVLLTLLLALASAAPSSGAISAAGDLMFTGFNADGNDDIAFVLLNSYTANTPIFFTDNEWDGSSWIDTSETFFHWSSAVNLDAGTVITLGGLSSGTIATNTGSASFDSGTNFGLGASNEALYAFVGASFDTATPGFLTAFANSGFVGNPTGFLTNTGLTAGSTATEFTNGADIFAYTGSRSNQAAWAAYDALTGGTANWASQDGSGDQSVDGIGPDVPFNTTPFSINASVPEPRAPMLAALCVAGLLTLRRRTW